MAISDFEINISDARVEDIWDRVRRHRWHEPPQDSGWTHGPDPDWFQSFIQYWRDEYDWRRVEAGLNQLPHFKANIDGLDIHFIHIRSPRADAQPLLLVHGWPGSFLEFLEMIGPLSDPAAHGDLNSPAFHLIIPSLPGYAFSDKPAKPIGPRGMAAYLAKLMTAELGYDGYVAQGGDWGSVVCSWLGFEHAPACRAIHLNMFGVRPSVKNTNGPGFIPAPVEGEAETAWRRKGERWHRSEGGYYHVQATKPETLAYAMMDSPVGIAAWISDKFRSWIDGRETNLEKTIGRERLLTNILLYIVNDAFPTAAWTYRGFMDEGSHIFPDGRRVEVPVGCANFPHELVPFAPRNYVERAYNVTHWTDMARGGHFAAMEAPDLMIEDIRAFTASLEPETKN
jgi:pimeloyl-ACP methyl ester carboxylesterase